MIVLYTMLTFYAGCGATTWQGPANAVVVAGRPMAMTCQTPLDPESIDWYYTAFGSSERLAINQGTTVYSRFTEFRVSGDIPGQVLTLESTQMKHAGIYECTALVTFTNTTGNLVESTAMLAVLESDPVCSLKSQQIKTGDQIEMSCSVSYSGRFSPAVEWKQHRTQDDSEGGSVIKDGQIDTTVSHNTVTSTAKITADIGRHNSTYSCRTYFTLPSTPLHVNATNAPDYSHTWASPSVQVIYGPSEVAVVPTQDVFYPGDVLTCKAEASPSPEFEWRSLDTAHVFNGPEMVIRTSMIRKEPYVFQCNITHALTGSKVTSQSVQFTVENGRCKNTLADDTNLLIIVALVSVCVIIITAFSVHIICLKKRIRTSASSNGQTRPRNDTTLLIAANNDPTYIEYSEIPTYSVCREAMERCNGPANNVGYLPMEQKTNSTIHRPNHEASRSSCAAACKENAYQNNEYMEASDEVRDPDCFATANHLIEIQTTEDQNKDTYVDLSERKLSSSTDYTVLSSTVEEQHEEEQPMERKQIDEKEQSDYLDPLPA